MTIYEFLDALRELLKGMPPKEREESIAYYREMIEDRIEDGATEQDAVAAVGTPEQAAEQILRDTPITKLVKERVKPKRRLAAWEIVLLILGSPVWVPLLVAAIVVVLSLYVVLWSLVISLYAVMVACLATGIVGVVYFFMFCVGGNFGAALVLLGAGIALIGISIFSFLGASASAKGLVALIGKLVLGIKKMLAGKGENA